MRVIAAIDDPQAVEKILRHLGAWHDPPAGLSPPGGSRPYTYEPCEDVDPMPDHPRSAQYLRASKKANSYQFISLPRRRGTSRPGHSRRRAHGQ